MCLKTDGSGYGKLGRGNGGGKPTFSDGQRGGFVNRSDRCGHPDYPGQGQPARSGSPAPSTSPQTTTGIGSIAGAAICRSCWGMTTIRSGSTPRRHRPRSAASSADIATVGSSCSRLLHHDIRPSSAQHILDLVPIHALMRDHHQRRAVAACHASEAHVAPSPPAPRHPVSNIAQPTPQPSYSVGQASRRVQWDDGKAPVVASADHWHMPFHHERIIGRRHHTHAADRQVNGQPSPPRRSRRAVMQRSRRSARSGSPIPQRAAMTCCCAAYVIAIW